jgi:hypothetical protein
MNIDCKQNFEEKIRLILIDSTFTLEDKYDLMVTKYAAHDLLRSGGMTKETMTIIAEVNTKVYSEILSYIDALNLTYSSSLENDISELAQYAQKQFKTESIAKLEKCTEMVGNPKSFEKILPEVEAEMASSYAIFKNNLNAKVLYLKQTTVKSPVERALWALEIICLVVTIFVSGMWFNNPDGNYEPLIVCLTAVMILIPLIIRRIGKQ